MKLSRSTKKMFIVAIYLAIFFLLGWLIYSWLKPDQNCFDSKQNQNEEGVDCGGVCQKQCEKDYKAQDLIIKEATFVSGGQERYDAIMRVSNPNNQLGVSKFSYEFKLKDANGNVLAEKSGTSFILPVESKYIIEIGLESKTTPVEIEAIVSAPEWKEFFGYKKPELNIYNKEYNLISSGVGYSEAKGVLRNESSFDFELIKVSVVLRDGNGKPVAFNKTEINTVRAGEDRGFNLLWPISFPGSVQGVPEMEAEANVFDSQNFIKQYTKDSQRFQENK